MSKKWVKLAEVAAEIAADHLDNGNISASADWHDTTLRRAAVAQAAALTRLADNNNRAVSMLDRIATTLEDDNLPPAA